MYNSTFSVLSPTTNLTFEVNGSNGAMRIGNGANVVADPTAGSLTLGSHVILNADTAAVPTTANRPGVGRRGMLRFNDTNNSAEIFDGSNWADVGYYAGLPLGAIIAYPSSSVPGPSFKLCDGSPLLKVGTYADLFALIGNTYGGVDPNFNLPNIKGRTIVGLDSTDAEFNSLGRADGFKTHTLSQDQMPQHDHPFGSGTVSGTITFTGTRTETEAIGGHTHNVTDTGHQHDYLYRKVSDPQVQGSPGNYTVMRDDQGQATYQTGSGSANISETTAGGHSHYYTPTGGITHNLSSSGGTTSKTGSTLPHNNLQPYIVLNYFIKVTKESSRYTSPPLVSDIRVKRNIQILNSNQAIEMIRLLQPKRYEYIDSNISEFTTHIGFIAQEAKLCIPESVRMKKEFIPNVYSMSNLTIVSTNADYKTALITSIQKPITTPIQCELRERRLHDDAAPDDESISIKNVKLKIFNRSKECFCVSCIESIDEYNIMVQFGSDMSSIVNDTYFVYGQEIADYHYMNNDAVFSTLVSAFQELDNRVKKQDIIIEKISNMLKLTI
jgi:microcystin-dependent protein